MFRVTGRVTGRDRVGAQVRARASRAPRTRTPARTSRRRRTRCPRGSAGRQLDAGDGVARRALRDGEVRQGDRVPRVGVVEQQRLVGVARGAQRLDDLAGVHARGPQAVGHAGDARDGARDALDGDARPGGEPAVAQPVDVDVAVPVRGRPAGPRLPRHAGVVLPQVRERLAVERPRGGVPPLRGVRGALGAVHVGPGHVGDDGAHQAGVGGAQQERELAAPRLAAHHDDAATRRELAVHVVQRGLEVLQRRGGDVVGQPGNAEVAERERLHAARRVERAALLVDPPAGAVEHDDRRVGAVALRHEERADEPVLADLAPSHPGPGPALHEVGRRALRGVGLVPRLEAGAQRA